ncbi:hypothetical protein DI005_33645 [Prauserella sp. PE36]|nr:hypothetical protein DI005_33645 [Prauserella sp. PE36]
MTHAPQSVSPGLLEDHLSRCVVATGGADADEKAREAREAVARLGRS